MLLLDLVWRDAEEVHLPPESSTSYDVRLIPAGKATRQRCLEGLKTPLRASRTERSGEILLAGPRLSWRFCSDPAPSVWRQAEGLTKAAELGQSSCRESVRRLLKFCHQAAPGAKHGLIEQRQVQLSDVLLPDAAGSAFHEGWFLANPALMKAKQPPRPHRPSSAPASLRAPAPRPAMMRVLNLCLADFTGGHFPVKSFQPQNVRQPFMDANLLTNWIEAAGSYG